MKSYLHWIDSNFERVLCSILFIGVSLLMSVNVVLLTFFKTGFAWASEAVLIAFAFFVWVGISYGIQQRAHISITILNDKLSERFKSYLNILVSAILLLFFFLVLVYGMQWMSHPAVIGKKSLLLHIPMSIVYATVPVGSALALVRLTQNIYRDVKQLRLGEAGN